MAILSFVGGTLLNPSLSLLQEEFDQLPSQHVKHSILSIVCLQPGKLWEGATLIWNEFVPYMARNSGLSTKITMELAMQAAKLNNYHAVCSIIESLPLQEFLQQEAAIEEIMRHGIRYGWGIKVALVFLLDKFKQRAFDAIAVDECYLNLDSGNFKATCAIVEEFMLAESRLYPELEAKIHEKLEAHRALLISAYPIPFALPGLLGAEEVHEQETVELLHFPLSESQKRLDSVMILSTMFCTERVKPELQDNQEFIKSCAARLGKISYGVDVANSLHLRETLLRYIPSAISRCSPVLPTPRSDEIISIADAIAQRGFYRDSEYVELLEYQYQVRKEDMVDPIILQHNKIIDLVSRLKFDYYKILVSSLDTLGDLAATVDRFLSLRTHIHDLLKLFGHDVVQARDSFGSCADLRSGIMKLRITAMKKTYNTLAGLRGNIERGGVTAEEARKYISTVDHILWPSAYWTKKQIASNYSKRRRFNSSNSKSSKSNDSKSNGNKSNSSSRSSSASRSNTDTNITQAA
jgi:hypothetical protein